MNNETTKPLYKVLNEQRTQGEWWSHSPIIKFPVHRVLCGEPPEASEVAKFFTATMDNADKQQANAQYTALAVNNLHHLAEALEGMRDLYNEIYPLIDDGATKEFEGYKWKFDQVAEALEKIS